jgi:polysaccharide biosynthesis protein PelA
MKKIFIIFLLCTFPLHAEFLPRRVIAFWDSSVEHLEDSLMHRTIEMPLNYLGLDVLYSNIQEPLPSFKGEDIRGIVVCFGPETHVPNPEAFIHWLIQAIDNGKKVIIMCNPGFESNKQGIITPVETMGRLYDKLGLTVGQWIEYTFDYKMLSPKNDLVSFESELPIPLPGFNQITIDKSFAKSYLTVGIPEKPETHADLAVMSPNGGYISQFYANNYDPLLYVNTPQILHWYINPFLFFEMVFDLFGVPVPDTTTLAGKRIFYSVCHGDGWTLETDIEKYRNENKICSEVVLDEIIKPNPDIPVAMGVVAATVDPSWVGTKKSQEVARQYFDLPQVDPASHSFSHPFDWLFFKEGQPDKEINYLHLYPYGSWQNSFLSWNRAKFYQFFRPQKLARVHVKRGYVTPRAFANQPFNLNLEIEGSIDYLRHFLPQGRSLDLYLWPGDCLPWVTPVELCYKHHLKNHGGGFVRFDENYPSNLFVAALARKPGGYIQLYSSANAENDYTHGWRDQFFAFQYLPTTLKNTESPRRIKPILLYYHSYSGEFEASLRAVLKNIEFIRRQNPIAITANRFVDIGLGFFTTEIEKMGENKWKILNRGGLQTIRIDSSDLQVDFQDSHGIIGSTVYQGSLYVYLDQSVDQPIISVKRNLQIINTPSLLESNWEIWNLQRGKNRLNFQTKGWGKLTMAWNFLEDGLYTIRADGHQTEIKTENHILRCELDLPYNREIYVEVTPSQ